MAMAAPSSPKPDAVLGVHSTGQDSAVQIIDEALHNLPAPPHHPQSDDGNNSHDDDDDDNDDGNNSHDNDNDNNNNNNNNNNDDNDDDDGYDSGFDSGSLLGGETDTLASSILHYRIENGRQYHAYRDGAYWGPNDEQAKELLDFAHHMYLLTLDHKLFLAPVQTPQNILDVGTGTGIWCIDIADQYPHATVTGTDLSPIQPEWVPPNCHFEIDDVTLDWTFPPNHFDFIHIRELFGCIPDWDFFFQQAYEHTKPGGWIEIVEHSVQPIADDDTMGPNHFYHLWGATVVELGKKFGKSFTIWSESKERMTRAGFVDVVEVPYKWPMNGWSQDRKLKNIGRWNQLRLHEGIEGFMIRLLTQVGGWSVARAQVFLAEMRRELKSYKTHAYLPGAVVYGRKPLRS